MTIQNYFTVFKYLQPTRFMKTHKQVSQDETKKISHCYTINLVIKSTIKKKMSVSCKIKSFLNSFVVILKTGLCSNNRSTAISIVSYKGMLANKLETS